MIPVVALRRWFRSQIRENVASEALGVDGFIERKAFRLSKVRQSEKIEALPYVVGRGGTIRNRIFPYRVGESLARLVGRLVAYLEKNLLPGASHEPVRLPPFFRVLIETG